MRYSSCYWIYCLFWCGVAAQSGDDFSNNLAQDLGPLLSLFGEKFAQQYLSESFSWLDNIIFAMAPLGIITAISSAIRVAGPGWLRAFIGRARENRAAVEIELMSSTSHEVCELWNGEAVVRSLGRPPVKQIIRIKSEQDNEETFGLYTLETAYGSKINYQDYHGPLVFKWPFGNRDKKRVKNITNDKTGKKWHSKFSRSKEKKTKEDDLESGAGVKDQVRASTSAVEAESKTGDGARRRPANSETEPTLSGASSAVSSSRVSAISRKSASGVVNKPKNLVEFEASPNIALNLHQGNSTLGLVSAAIIGIVLQAGVLVQAGLIAKNETVRKKVPDGPEQPGYGFPLVLAGTIVLSIGLVLVSNVIQTSTSEKRWFVIQPKAPQGNELDHPLPTEEEAKENQGAAKAETTQKNREIETAVANHAETDQTTANVDRIKNVSVPETTSTEIGTSAENARASSTTTDKENNVKKASVPEVANTRINTSPEDDSANATTAPDKCIKEEATNDLGDADEMTVFWLQQERVVGDQSFNSFIIVAKEARKHILTSCRSDEFARRAEVEKDNTQAMSQSTSLKKSHMWTKAFTTVSAGLSVVGFILQFQGFRGINWTCAVMQLGVVVIMTAIRAGTRAGLLERPRAIMTIVDHEMDSFAEKLSWGEFDDSRPDAQVASHSSAQNGDATSQVSTSDGGSGQWMVHCSHRGFCKNASNTVQTDSQKSGQRAVNIRHRLGKLTAWKGPVTEPANAAARAIELAVLRFFKQQSVEWEFNIPIGPEVTNVQFVVGAPGAVPLAGRKSVWGDDLTGLIEAVLSLWLHKIHRARGFDMDQLKATARYILGPSSPALQRDMAWWIGSVPYESQEYTKAYSLENGGLLTGCALIHCPQYNTAEPQQIGTPVLTIPPDTSVEMQLARHLFSSFMWTVARDIQPEQFTQSTTYRLDGKADMFRSNGNLSIFDKTSWTCVGFQNFELDAFISDVRRAGLGTRDESAMLIIPSLSHFHILPDEIIFDVFRDLIRNVEKDMNWDVCIALYAQLLGFCSSGVSLKMARRAMIYLIDFGLILSSFGVDQTPELGQAVSAKFGKALSEAFKTYLKDLSKLYYYRGRAEEFNIVMGTLISLGRQDLLVTDDEKEFFEFDETHIQVVTKGNTSLPVHRYAKDLTGWTPFHYAASTGNYDECNKYLGGIEKSRFFGLAVGMPEDIANRTPLHYAVIGGDDLKLVKSLSRLPSGSVPDRYGLYPVHWAVMRRRLNTARYLIQSATSAELDPLGNGETLLHLAIRFKLPDIAELIISWWSSKINIDGKNVDGMTPLHLACAAGYETIVKQLVESGVYSHGINKQGKTPLELAKEGDHKDIVIYLNDQELD